MNLLENTWLCRHLKIYFIRKKIGYYTKYSFWKIYRYAIFTKDSLKPFSSFILFSKVYKSSSFSMGNMWLILHSMVERSMVGHLLAFARRQSMFKWLDWTTFEMLLISCFKLTSVLTTKVWKAKLPQKNKIKIINYYISHHINYNNIPISW